MVSKFQLYKLHTFSYHTFLLLQPIFFFLCMNFKVFGMMRII